MRTSSANLGLFFCLAGLAVFVLMTSVGIHIDRDLRQKEPYYKAPVYFKDPFLTLRNDSYGKGFFGASRDGGRTHKGIDILAPVGQPVLAAKSGRIFFAGTDKGYGWYVEIHHPDGLRTRYAHLSRIDVMAGDWIRQGSVLGACGKTGNASNHRMSPHLHFEILSPEGAANPSRLLDPILFPRRH